MLMALALLLFPAQEIPQALPDEPPKTAVAANSSVSAAVNKDAERTKFKPKTAEFSAGNARLRDAKELNKRFDSNSTGATVGANPVPMATVSPLWAKRQEQRTPQLWWALAGAGHSAAAFDAYASRRAIQTGRGRELNPLMQPFANSNALYFATQAQPALLDFVGLHLLHSNKRWMRRLWWVPQVAGTAASLWVGAHNLRIGSRPTPGQLP
ncbi:MAG: hypothetical protein L0387_22640 [Acidobacteria bacterium]|nr:hypothetical protein [Acidobacteriota bacterium]